MSSSRLNQSLTRLAGELEGLAAEAGRGFQFRAPRAGIQVQLGFAMESEDRNTVFWIERRGGRIRREDKAGIAEQDKRKWKVCAAVNVFLQATPIDVGPILRECLWSKLDMCRA